MKIRVDKDVEGLKFYLQKGSVTYNPKEVLNLKIEAISAEYKQKTSTWYQILYDNYVEFGFSAKSVRIGRYNIIISFDVVSAVSPTGSRHEVLDFADAFTIVRTSEEEDLTAAVFVGELTYGLDGKNAFEVWQINHPGGTIEEYEAYLKHPATDAAAAANEAADSANNAATGANQAAGNAEDAAALANQKAALANEAAGSANNAATGANQAAGNAEDAAALANQKAALANEAAGSANNAATGANQAAGNAEDAAALANQKAALANEAALAAALSKEQADAAEALRQQQEDARKSAETARNVASNVYNVTLAVPLTAGSYYTSTTARAAIPSGVRKRGLELVYETSAGVWYCERFIGASVTTWTTPTDWEIVPTKKYVDDAGALKINKSDIANNLTTTDAGKVLDARQGKVLNDNVSFIFDVIGWYGVSWDTAVSTTPMTRTGNAQMHRTLPIQSKMRGCLVSDSGTVTYLPATWSDATLDGSAGQVMVEIPQHYRYFPPANGTIMECRISEYPLPNFTLVPKSYISAYEATVARSTNKLSSVVNATTEYRGGNNSATNDANSNTLLGKPATNLTRAQFRTYARNRGAGWEMLDYKTYNTLFWLYFVEYANTNSQLAVNSALDGNGYKQGGLGNGVTDIVSADWNTFNNYYPIVNCGASNSLGNGSGEVSYTVPFTVPVTTKVNRYRGIENPFGHIWKNCDGIIFDVKTDADGGTSNIYICSTPSNYSDSITANYALIGQIPRTNGYIKALQSGSFLPLEIGGGSTTYWCDYFYQSIASSSLRTLILGGFANNGSAAGLCDSYAHYSVASADTYIGSRLCFFPQ